MPVGNFSKEADSIQRQQNATDEGISFIDGVLYALTGGTLFPAF